MAVIRSHDVLWEEPIPYVGKVPEVFRQAMDAIHAQVGFDIWVPAHDASAPPPSWIKFEQVGSGNCSEIGCQKCAGQVVKLREGATVFTAMHELLHCAGFEHEQLHPGYAWDRNDIPDILAKEARLDSQLNSRLTAYKGRHESDKADLFGRMDARPIPPKHVRRGSLGRQPAGRAEEISPAMSRGETMLAMVKPKIVRPTPTVPPPPPVQPNSVTELHEALQTDWNRALAVSLGEGREAMYVEGWLRDLGTKKVVQITSFCDYDSIMMYPEFLAAARVVEKTFSDRRVDTGGAGWDSPSTRTRLSQQDVNCLRLIYRKTCGRRTPPRSQPGEK